MTFPRQKKPFIGSHFEKLGDVNGTSAFTTTSYSLNPGLSGTFPWMASIAENFEMYKFTRLEFWYVQATATSTTGTVYMAFDPDAVDAAPPSATALIDLNVKTVGSPYINLKLNIPPKSKFAKDLYVRTGSVSGTDLKTYDLGNFYISTDGCNVTTKIGALFVSYSVALISPELPILNSTVSGMSILSTTPTTASLFQTPTIAGSALGTVSGDIFTFTSSPSPLLISFEMVGTNVASSITVVASAGTITNNFQVNSTGVGATYIGVLTGATVGTTLTFACTVVTATKSLLYLSVLPSGVTYVPDREEILFERFQRMLRKEENLRALEDQKIERRITNLEQDEEEGLDLSDDEPLYIERTPTGDVVRLHNVPCISPHTEINEAFHEGSMASGSLMHVNEKRRAREARYKTSPLPTPTENIPISVKGKEK
jgi:hypothetical protein